MTDTALNGVKQGAVLSPILYCVYVNDLLLILSKAGVGCFIGLHFVGELAYADDLVLLAPTTSVMPKLLAICEDYAREYSISFNALKSKCLVALPKNCRHTLKKSMIVFFTSMVGWLTLFSRFLHLLIFALHGLHARSRSLFCTERGILCWAFQLFHKWFNLWSLIYIINSYVNETTLDHVAFLRELIMIRDSSIILSGLLSSDELNDVISHVLRAS